MLEVIFVDVRINQWRDGLPEATRDTKCVRTTTNYLPSEFMELIRVQSEREYLDTEQKQAEIHRSATCWSING